MRGSTHSLRTSKPSRTRIGAFIAAKRIRSLPNENRGVQAAYCVFAACSASVIHLSAISMKKDLCCEVRAASAKRMHSAANGPHVVRNNISQAASPLSPFDTAVCGVLHSLSANPRKCRLNAAVEVPQFSSLGSSFGLGQLLRTRSGQLVVGRGSPRRCRPATLLQVIALFPVRRDLL